MTPPPSLSLTPDLVWRQMQNEIFACLSFVTPAGEPRSAGIVYVVEGRKLFIATNRDTWKARYIAANPHVALTVTIAKRIPFLPWIKIPPATISFHGTARVLGPDELDEKLRRRLLHANAANPEELAAACIIEVLPAGHFATYGVGTTLLGMRDHVKARGRVPVA